MIRIIPEYKSLAEILQDAITKESDAEQYYLEAAEIAQQIEVREFLLEMATMERDHFNMLSTKLESLQAEQSAMAGILSSYDESADTSKSER